VTRHGVATGALLALGFVALAGGISFRVLDLRLLTVLSGSMRPTVAPGDVVVTEPVPVTDLRVGDVIAFYPPDRTVPVLHRITSLAKDGGLIAVTTRGDANVADDPWVATIKGATGYRMVGYLPLVGWLSQYRGLLFLAAGLLIGAALVRGVWKEMRPNRPGPA
jgi:signal peptidase